MGVKNMHVIWQSAALCKSLAAEFSFSKKYEIGMPMSIGSHVEVAAKAVGTLGAAQDMCGLSGEAFLKTVTWRIKWILSIQTVKMNVCGPHS
jgi:hypothetical protein